jgi:hypothetical protein
MHPNSLTYINTLLASLLGSEKLVAEWWKSPNLAFEKAAPVDVDLNEVIAYVEQYYYLN